MILITGANGFIGQHLIPKIVKKYPSNQIICLVSKPTKLHEKNGLKVLQKNKLTIVEADLRNKKSLKPLSGKYSLIIHLAASVDTSESDFAANDRGTENLYKTIGPLNKKTHFIFISTAAVWAGRKDCANPITELEQARTNNQYGATKLAAERFLTKQSLKDKFILSVLRLNTVYGADPREDKLFGVMKDYIKKRSLISRINWPGKFGIVHVSDVVKTILAVADPPGKKPDYQMFIVTTENITLTEISKQMHKAMGYKYQPIIIPSVFWTILKRLNFLLYLGPLLPAKLYNPLWRASLILDNVLMASPERILKTFPNWRRKSFKNHVKEVINV